MGEGRGAGDEQSRVEKMRCPMPYTQTCTGWTKAK